MFSAKSILESDARQSSHGAFDFPWVYTFIYLGRHVLWQIFIKYTNLDIAI